MNRSLVLLAILWLGLSSCGLLEQGEDLIYGAKGTLKISLLAPKGSDATITIAGINLNQRYNDDGRGFKTSLTLRPGSYTVTASPLEGYTARLLRSEASGNSTLPSPVDVIVTSGAIASLEVSYAPNP